MAEAAQGTGGVTIQNRGVADVALGGSVVVVMFGQRLDLILEIFSSSVDSVILNSSLMVP